MQLRATGTVKNVTNFYFSGIELNRKREVTASDPRIEDQKLIAFLVVCLKFLIIK